MIFSPYESLTILKRSTKLSRDDIHLKGGPHPRVQQRILNENPQYTLKNEDALTRILVDQGVMPIDWAWNYPISKIRELQDKEDLTGILNQWSALYTSAVSVIETDSQNISREFRLGALLFAAFYIMPFVKPKNSNYVHNKSAAKHAAIKYFSIIIDELKDDNTPCGLLLKLKCIGNIVVIEWNSRTIEERTSIEMRAILNRIGYFDLLMKLAELFPANDTAMFNAACIASTLQWTEMYEHLDSALLNANPNYRDHIEFLDEDFADFRMWLRRKYPSYALESKVQK